MAGGKFIDVRVTGIERILRKMNKHNPLYAEPWMRALHAAAEIVKEDMRRTAPGSLEARITTRLHARPVPLYAKVGLMPMPKRKGYRYPGALHGGHRYHYRSGPELGRPTFGWLTRPLDRLRARIQGLLSVAANEIKSDWESE